MLAYGAVNAVQDAWLEQLVKRGWVGWEIPSALRPGFVPVWLAVLALAGACAWALTIEGERERRLVEARGRGPGYQPLVPGAPLKGPTRSEVTQPP